MLTWRHRAVSLCQIAEETTYKAIKRHIDLISDQTKEFPTAATAAEGMKMEAVIHE